MSMSITAHHDFLNVVWSYLAYSTEAEKIRQVGNARTLRDHTYQCCFQALFTEIVLENS